QGRAVRKITTHALPPLADMPTLAMGALPTIPARPRRLTASMRLAALTAVGLVAVGTAWLLGRPSGAPGPAVGAPVDSPSGRSVPPPRPVIRRRSEEHTSELQS